MACSCCSCEHLTCKLIVTEVVRYLAILLPLSLAVWRASNYTENTLALRVVWISLMIAGGTLVCYLPLKCLCKQKFLEKAREGYGWWVSIIEMPCNFAGSCRSFWRYCLISVIRRKLFEYFNGQINAIIILVVVSTWCADGLAPSDAWSSAGTMMTYFEYTCI